MRATYTFGERSIKQLARVHPTFVEILKTALAVQNVLGILQLLMGLGLLQSKENFMHKVEQHQVISLLGLNRSILNT